MYTLLTWDKNIVIVKTPNQLCKLYKFGIGGSLYICEAKDDHPANNIRIIIQPLIIAWWFFKSRFL